MTLTDIADFFLNEDKVLQKKITLSHLAFEELKIQLNDLQDCLKGKPINTKVT